MTLQFVQPAGIIMAFCWHDGYLDSGLRATKSDTGYEVRRVYEPRVVVRVVQVLQNLDIGIAMPSHDAKLL